MFLIKYTAEIDYKARFGGLFTLLKNIFKIMLALKNNACYTGREVKHMKTVLSLFDGMSCGQIALNRAGIAYDKYYASEIEKHAIKVTQRNYPNTVQLGDINNWRDWQIEWNKVDLIFAGSPCQGFSFIGKQLAFDDPRSKLFFVFVEILNYAKKHNPNVKFLLENVRMNPKYEAIITDYMGVDCVKINSRLLTAQNRPRLYWCNWHIDKPKDTGVLLNDILESNIPTDSIISDRRKSWLEKFKQQKLNKYYTIDPKKAQCLTRRGDAGWNCTYVIRSGQLTRLTPIEWERLQGVPDNYTSTASNAKRYEMLGNGWTVDIIVHLLSTINQESLPVIKQLKLF